MITRSMPPSGPDSYTMTITGIDFSLGDVAPDIRPCYAHANYPGWPAGPQSGG